MNTIDEELFMTCSAESEEQDDHGDGIRRYNEVKRLIKDGANVNYIEDGKTTLIEAAFHGHEDICRLLLDNGADIHRKSMNGGSALDYAAYQCHGQVVKLLVERGASLHTKNSNGYTSLELAYHSPETNYRSIISILTSETQKQNVIYISSNDIQNRSVTFKDFDPYTVIITDDDKVDDESEYEGFPLISLQSIEQCIHNLPTYNSSNNDNHDNDEDAISADNQIQTLHNVLQEQMPQDVLDQTQHWKLNILHLLVYFPGKEDDENDENDDSTSSCSTSIYHLLLTLLTKCPEAINTVDMNGKTPLHHAAISYERYPTRTRKSNKRCYDLLLHRSSETVVHEAIQAGMSWYYLRPIILAKIHALSLEDEESGLLPFMLAAESKSRDNHFGRNHTTSIGNDKDDVLGELTLVYELLCLTPEVLKDYDVSTEESLT